MPVRRMQKWKKRSMQGAGLAVFLGWILWMCFAIATQPPKGAASLTELRDDVRTAVTQGNADRLQELFDEDGVADGYASSFLERLRDTGTSDAEVVLEKRGETNHLVVKGSDRGGAAVCTPWAVTEKDARWYLDGTPPVAGDLC
ncbi:hypothetical protein [Streptomyces sp. PTD5-9]|uniref:hypothetical protein n=1 Tax=Streptomyces sp. PTD5-9 TaxID=3120150 RepID=UPI00300B71A4